MGVHEHTASITPEDKEFQECLTRGDDFCKIELYRHAVEH
jgi:hypothetical protein